MIATKAEKSLPLLDYAVLARIYDDAVALPVFPLLCGTFEHAVKRHNATYRSLADLGCGTGNFSRYIARKGIVTMGVDNSQAMLILARKKKKDLPIHFFQQDLRELQLPEPVDMITCQFNTINYFIKLEDIEKIFRKCYQSLNQGGHLLFDFITGSGASALNEKRKIRYGPWISYWNIQTYPEKSLSRVRITVTDNHKHSKHVSEIHVQRWYPLEVISTLLQKTGFSLIECFDLEKLKPANQDSYWIQFCAKKLHS